MTETNALNDGLPFPVEYESVLREQIIDEERPGPILRDFGTLLDFIGPEGINIKDGKKGLLPNKVIQELNSKMNRPMSNAQKRPRQAGFPYLHGLYLLLRSTGLGVLEGKGTKRRIALNEALLDSWQSLNSTEKYFSALEAWMERGNPEIIGERHGWWNGHAPECSRFLFEIPDTGLAVREKRNNDDLIRYGPGFYNLALMDLFGFVVVEEGSPEPGQGWCIERVERTPFGTAMFTMLSPIGAGIRLALKHTQTEMAAGDRVSDGEPPEVTSDVAAGLLAALSSALGGPEEALERWQAPLRPYFPEWRNSLAAKETPYREGTYVLKAKLGDAWCRIAATDSMVLDGLCWAILDAFDFDDDHLYAFYYKDKLGVSHEASAPASSGDLTADDVCLGEMELDPGDSFEMLYDFGDSWRFKIELERIGPAKPSMERPELIEFHGNAPRQYPNWDEEDDDWEDDDEENEEAR